MGNPLLFARPFLRRRTVLRRLPVDIPTEVPATTAIFLVLRRMRAPLIALIVVFTIAVFGLAATPGVDGAGNPRRMSVFESFYVMSYTATTIGFGEIPNAFTTQQRLWVTATIYATVIAWAYAIGTLLALAQDESFRDAVAGQRFARRVRNIHEGFHIIAGYGQAGRVVGRGLDWFGRRFVVIDRSGVRVDQLGTDQLSVDIPGIEGDAANPAVLGIAGLGHKHCQGVLALTDDDQINLGVVQAVHLLAPEVPVIARCADRETATHMEAFGAEAVINAYDRFGSYLVLALQRPAVYQLVTWLMSPGGTGLPERGTAIASGTWVVCAQGQFRDEIARDLRAASYEVVLADPGDGAPDVRAAVGFVGGMSIDTANLALAAQVRTTAPDAFICLRQAATTAAPLYAAFAPDSLFVPTDLVAREAFARIVTPHTWTFLEYAARQDDAWAADLLGRLVDRCGSGSPDPVILVIDAQSAPAVIRWIEHGGAVTIRDLLRHPDNRDEPSGNAVLALNRGGKIAFDPDPETVAEAGDRLLLVSRARAFSALREVLFHDAAVEYVVTGRRVPATWIWRRLTRGRA